MGCAKRKYRWRAKDVGRKGYHYIRLRSGKKYGKLKKYKKRR